jgi:hypothetical protein
MTLVVLTVDVLWLYIGDTDVWVDVGRPLAVVAWVLLVNCVAV